jgi:predicted RNA-binding protein with RPS1 domain
MAEAIDAPDAMSPYAPLVTTIKGPVDKIGEVIGPKGKVINAITEETGAQISIEDDGTVFVGSTDGPSAQAAIDRINAIANPQLPKVGERFLGTVVKTTDFGAFVSLLPGRDGLVHISKLGKGKRIARVEDVLNVGDKLRVEIADIDKRGKISLVLVEEDSAAPADAPARPDIATPVYPVEAGALFAAVQRVAASQPRTFALASDPARLAASYVARSAVWNFPDVISVQVAPRGATSTLALYSRSLYGYADFGVNRARLETWLAALQSEVSPR